MVLGKAGERQGAVQCEAPSVFSRRLGPKGCPKGCPKGIFLEIPKIQLFTKDLNSYKITKYTKYELCTVYEFDKCIKIYINKIYIYIYIHIKI